MANYESGGRLPRYQQQATPPTGAMFDMEWWRTVQATLRAISPTMTPASVPGVGAMAMQVQARTGQYAQAQQSQQQGGGYWRPNPYGGLPNARLPGGAAGQQNYPYPNMLPVGIVGNQPPMSLAQRLGSFGSRYPSYGTPNPRAPLISDYAPTGGQDWTKYSPGVQASGVIGPNTLQTGLPTYAPWRFYEHPGSVSPNLPTMQEANKKRPFTDLSSGYPPYPYAGAAGRGSYGGYGGYGYPSYPSYSPTRSSPYEPGMANWRF